MDTVEIIKLYALRIWGNVTCHIFPSYFIFILQREDVIPALFSMNKCYKDELYFT